MKEVARGLFQRFDNPNSPLCCLRDLCANAFLGNDNYHSFSGGSYFSRLFWVLSARFFGVFLGWFSAFAGAGFRPPRGRRPKAGASVASGGILRA